MKNYFLLILLLVKVLALSSEVIIKLNIQGADYKQAYLCSVNGSRLDVVNSSVFAEGTVSFILDEPQKGMYKLILKDNFQIDLIVDNDQEILLETKFPNLKQNLNILKGDDNIRYYNFINYRSKEVSNLTKLISDIGENNRTAERIGFLKGVSSYKIKQYADSIIALDPKALLSKMLAAQMIPDLNLSTHQKPELSEYNNEIEFLLVHFFDNIDFNDEQLIRTDILFKAIKTYIEKIVLPRNVGGFNNANELIIAKTNNLKVKNYIISELLEIYETTQLEEVYSKLYYDYVEGNPSILSQKQQLNILKKINIIEQAKPGSKAFNFSFVDPNGHDKELSSIKTNFNIIVFYESDTKNISSTIKQLNHIYTTYNKNGIEIFAISLDRNHTKWKQFLSNNQFEYNNYLIKNGQEKMVQDHYNTWALPSIYILDKNNNILKKPMNVDYIRKECEDTF